MIQIYKPLLLNFLRLWVMGVLGALCNQESVDSFIKIPVWVSRIFFIKRYRKVPVPFLIWQILNFTLLIINIFIVTFIPSIFSVSYKVHIYSVLFLPMSLGIYYEIAHKKRQKRKKIMWQLLIIKGTCKFIYIIDYVIGDIFFYHFFKNH